MIASAASKVFGLRFDSEIEIEIDNLLFEIEMRFLRMMLKVILRMMLRLSCR